MTNNHIHRRGLGLKDQVKDKIDTDFSSLLIDQLKANDYQLTHGNLTIKLAREFGFCYGVERSIDYAYQTVKKFPDRRIFLTDEMIHNDFVNKRMLEHGVHFLQGRYQKETTIDDLTGEDIVILPAFGIGQSFLKRLQDIGCIIVDTTCGSVLNVWKFIKRASRENFTIVLHGKYDHPETEAAITQTVRSGNQHYLIVRDFAQAEQVATYIRAGGDKKAFLSSFEQAISPSFDPDVHLQKIALANQTTMLASESLAVGRILQQAMIDRFGEQHLSEHFRLFESVCSATQERQDALIDLLDSGVDLTIIVGGFNSSNTGNLARIAAGYGAAFHIRDESDILSAQQIRHRVGQRDKLQITGNWLPQRPLAIAISSGASTPDATLEAVIRKLIHFHE
jgi:4-hydroxy-3-methylbut-2-enyl diphosphate reductase